MSVMLERSLEESSPRPPWWRAALLRFGAVYWVLFCIPAVVEGIVPGLSWVGQLILPGFDAVLTWLGRHVLGIAQPLSLTDNGSGDRLGWWLYIALATTLAVGSAGVWTWLDRRRAHDAALRAALRVLLRYALAFVMLFYGTLKLFVLQFPAPSPARMIVPFGNASPMGLLWTFMGASPAYVVFSGAAEALGAVLLLFRRTTLLGALVLAVVLTNVVLLNLCYDVSVKLHSMHLLAMSVTLLVPDLGRLARAILHNGAIPARSPARSPVDRRWRRARPVVKYTVFAVLVIANLHYMIASRQTGPARWYDGVWNVTAFTRNGTEFPPLVTDPARWRRLAIRDVGEYSFVRWYAMDDRSGPRYQAIVDPAARTITATFLDEPTEHGPPQFVLRYTQLDADHLSVTGNVGGAELTMTLERLQIGIMPLMSRGFHWVTELPYSR